METEIKESDSNEILLEYYWPGSPCFNVECNGRNGCHDCKESKEAGDRIKNERELIVFE